MADKSDLQRIPQTSGAPVLSETRSILIARASKDAQAIMARKPEAVLRAKVKVNGKWGFLSKYGKFVIDPRFDDLGDFSEGLCTAKVDGRYGVIDRSGDFVIKPNFDDIRDFREGLARVRIDEKYGFIGRTGETVIPPVFDSAGDFGGGVAQATSDEKSCIIDREGSIIFTRTVEKEGGCVFFEEEVGAFSEDLALVSGDYYARASDCGHDVQECDGVCEDDPCTCPYSKRKCWECHWRIGYYIDRKGETIPMPEEIIGIGGFREGLALVGEPHTRWEEPQTIYKLGYINTRGEVVIPPQYHSAEDFADGTARVYTDKEEWRLIDKEGNFVNALGSEDSESVECETKDQDGLTRIEADGLYGFSDERGNIVIEPIFAWVGHFSNGMARFKTSELSDAKWGFIDRAGTTVIAPQFDDAQDFEILSP